MTARKPTYPQLTGELDQVRAVQAAAFAVNDGLEVARQAVIPTRLPALISKLIHCLDELTAVAAALQQEVTSLEEQRQKDSQKVRELDRVTAKLGPPQ